MTKALMPQLILAALTMTATVAGCAVNPVKIQTTDVGGSAKYKVTIEFTSALNLPAGAKVAYEGDTVGSVSTVSLDDDAVAVLASLDTAARVPANATAAIVQDTILGDSYVQLTKSATGEAAPPLHDGDRIPTSRTRPPTSIEDMMTTLSSFLGTGSLQQLQSALRQLSAAMPQSDADTRRITSVLSADIRSLATHHTELEQTLDHLNHVASTLRERTAYLQDLVSDDSQIYWNNLMSTASYIGVLLPSVGSIFTQGYWLIPVLDSAATTMEQVGVATGADQIGFGWQLDKFTGTTLLPFLSSPRIDVTEVTGPDGESRTADTIRVLRMLGAIP